MFPLPAPVIIRITRRSRLSVSFCRLLWCVSARYTECGADCDSDKTAPPLSGSPPERRHLPGQKWSRRDAPGPPESRLETLWSNSPDACNLEGDYLHKPPSVMKVRIHARAGTLL
ncbi:hypothetical protein B0T26DRAFT_340058 [Lasiosphaeria miniovina]|uniref:Uncharacterized protein n=1 Tax=Lasiosphaeria miniovina TaxID=1954250 RepID=A0AA40AB18_9PEZI|nr:uncharacterized protein B0T26DRAFT_340058 [Lasiosphaeria miniovina]KAK0712562.1 hypothetical protein B0T26DRAFT_340058 [Lasiosphaeria miniovina]